MKGKKVNARTRIKCPLCGNLGWESQFKRDNPVLKMLIQHSPGYQKIEYQEVRDRSYLQQLYVFLVERVEKLYFRLTGIDIQKLLKKAGGEIEWQKSKSVSIQPVSTTEWLKTANLYNREKPNVMKTGSLRKVSTKHLTKC